MLGPLYSALKTIADFKRPCDQFVLLHLQRQHLLEWVRAMIAVALGVGIEDALPPVLVQEETDNAWNQISWVGLLGCRVGGVQVGCARGVRWCRRRPTTQRGNFSLGPHMFICEAACSGMRVCASTRSLHSQTALANAPGWAVSWVLLAYPAFPRPARATCAAPPSPIRHAAHPHAP